MITLLILLIPRIVIISLLLNNEMNTLFIDSPLYIHIALLLMGTSRMR